jgi:hypothetical protein
VNRYAYAGNDPVNFSDANGHSYEDAHGGERAPRPGSGGGGWGGSTYKGSQGWSGSGSNRHFVQTNCSNCYGSRIDVRSDGHGGLTAANTAFNRAMGYVGGGTRSGTATSLMSTMSLVSGLTIPMAPPLSYPPWLQRMFVTNPALAGALAGIIGLGNVVTDMGNIPANECVPSCGALPQTMNPGSLPDPTAGTKPGTLDVRDIEKRFINNLNNSPKGKGPPPPDPKSGWEKFVDAVHVALKVLGGG